MSARDQSTDDKPNHRNQHPELIASESLDSLRAPMIEFAKAENMGELATLLHARL